MTQTEKIDTAAEFDSLKTEWDALLKESGQSNIFLTYEWVHGWWSCFGQEGKRSLYILKVTAGGKTAGIFPLMREVRRGVRLLAFIGYEISDYEDAIIAGNSGQREEVVRAVRVFLAGQKDWDLLRLRKVRSGSLNYPAFRAALEKPGTSGAGARSYSHKQGVFYIDLAQGKDRYFSSLKRVFRADSRRRRRRLEERGTVRCERVRSAGDIEPLVARLREWHLSRRREKRQKTFFEDKRYQAFFERTGRALFDRGWLDLSILKSGDTVAAIHLGFRHGDAFFYYIPAFDDSLKPFAAGRLLCLDLLEQAFTENLRRFDFMLGLEEYKKDWNPSFEPLVSFSYFPSTMKGKVLNFLMNDLLIFCKKCLGKAW